jgi:hypothetical protein
VQYDETRAAIFDSHGKEGVGVVVQEIYYACFLDLQALDSKEKAIYSALIDTSSISSNLLAKAKLSDIPSLCDCINPPSSS